MTFSRTESSIPSLSMFQRLLGLWVCTWIIPMGSIVTPAEAVSYIPGDAEWLGDYGSGEDIPDVMDHLPYSYVVLGSGTSAIARVIVALNATPPCPPLVAEDDNMVMPIPEVTIRAEGNSKLPYAFPIRVCETYIELDSHKAAWTDGRLHFDGINKTTPITSDPQRFLLMGDTGLRSKPKNLGLGTCSSSPFSLYQISQCQENFTAEDLDPSAVSGDFQSLGESWPLKALQDFAAQEEADVIVYVGDYLYRQGPCPDASNQTCYAINGPPKFDVADLSNDTIANFLPGTWGDNLYGWWADLFWPAMELFQATPLIAIRGNHEICARGGHGYLLFLGHETYPTDTVAGQYCEDTVPPYAVSFVNEQFLIIDDSNIAPMNGGIDHYNFVEGACPQAPGEGDPPLQAVQTPRYDDPTQTPSVVQAQVNNYTVMMETLRELSLSYDTNFYAAHRPVFGVACNDTVIQSLDWTMQQASGLNTFNRVSACIGGHMHWLLVLLYQGFPHQIVVGHGGTAFIPNYVNQDSFTGLQVDVGKDEILKGVVERGISSSNLHGYAVMDRNENGDYDVVLKGLDGSSMVLLDFNFTIPKGPRVKEDVPTMNPVDYPTVPTISPAPSLASRNPTPTDSSDSSGLRRLSWFQSVFRMTLLLLIPLLIP